MNQSEDCPLFFFGKDLILGGGCVKFILYTRRIISDEKIRIYSGIFTFGIF